MKTIDAVKYFKGELPHPDDVISGLVECNVTCELFNTLVDELSTNFGKCKINFSEHCSNESVRLQTKPVYTQAMHETGELPSVGMKCLMKISGEFEQVTIKYNSEFVIVYSYIYADERTIEVCKEKAMYNIDIKPLEPPVKLVDGEAYRFDLLAGVSGLAGIFFDSAFHLYGESFGVDDCTNFKLLTVEGDK